MDHQTMKDFIDDLMGERNQLHERIRQLEDANGDNCPPHGTPRPNLSLYQLADDVPLVFWDVHIFRQSPGYIRATVFMSADKKKTEFTIETGPSPAGPWKELKRHL